MQRVAVIGSNGFIGRHLAEELSAKQSVQLFLFGKSAPLVIKPNAPYKTIDFFDREKLLKDFENIDLVYYLASETIPATSWDTPIIEVEKNLLPFINFLEAIVTLKTKKVVFVSSAGTVYGPTQGKVTEDSDKKPFSPYGITKLAMENFLNYYKSKHGLESDIYRVSNVYGEGQDTSKGLGIINTFLEKILQEKRVRIFGDGKSTRNYIYVGDVARLLSLSLTDVDSSGIYNIASGDTFSINDLVQLIKKVTAEEFDVTYEAVRQSDNSFIDLDNTRICKRFPGFKFTTIEDGLLKTYKSLKK
jgi:UDP-glucose 4-epimerase